MYFVIVLNQFSSTLRDIGFDVCTIIAWNKAFKFWLLYKLGLLVNARRRGMMVSRIKMMHEVVMEWMCTLLVIVWKEEHALSFECIIIIAVNMYLCCIYTHTTVDVQVTFFVLRKSLYLVYQVSSTLYIYIKKYLRRVFIYLLLCFFEN